MRAESHGRPAPADPPEPVPTLAEVVAADATNGWRAERALLVLAQLGPDDLARPEWLVAAQTFATLAVADAISEGLTSALTGKALADVVAGR